MGGKPWSKQEERIFWRVIARQAPPGLDANRRRARRTASQVRNWAALATHMATLMDAAVPGVPHRNYNSIGLYEHYHHNYIRNKDTTNGKYSPNAYQYVREYEAWLNQNGDAASNGSFNASTAPQLPAQPTHRQQTNQPRQTQAQTQSMYARDIGAQGVRDFNRPMPPPPTPQTHDNVGYGGSYGYPGYNVAQPYGNAAPAPSQQSLHNGSTVAGGRSFSNAGPASTRQSSNNASPASGGHSFGSGSTISDGRFFGNFGPAFGRQSSNNAGPTSTTLPFSNAGPTPTALLFSNAGPASTAPSFNNGSIVSGGRSFGNVEVGSDFDPTQAVPDDQTRSFCRKQDGSARFSSQ